MTNLFNNTKEGNSLIQLIRYGSIGIATNLAGYLVFVIIVHLGIEPKRTMTFMYAAGAAFGFFANRNWTFSHQGRMAGAGLRYCIAHLGGYLIDLLLLYTFVDRLGYRSQWVQAAAVFVVAAYLFVAFKYFVFPENGLRDEVLKMNRRFQCQFTLNSAGSDSSPVVFQPFVAGETPANASLE